MNRACMFLAIGLFCASAVEASTYSYTNWATATNGTPGSAAGVIHAPGGDVSVIYTGELTASQVNNTGSYEWSPASTFTSSTVSNLPPTKDIIKMGTNGVSYGGTNKITFSQPVVDPILSIVSLGGGTDDVKWVFDANLVVLSRGPSSNWGGSAANFTQPQPNAVNGHEASGVIEFPGTFSSLSFVQSANPNDEFWHGFTVGISGIPEPSAVFAALLLVGAAGVRRRKPVALAPQR